MIMDNNFQSWFIPFDVFNLICHSLVIIFAFIFLFIIIGDKTCHTVPMLLVANSCLAELVFSSNLFWMAIFTLNNDLKRQQYEDSLCVFRVRYVKEMSKHVTPVNTLIRAQRELKMVYRIVILVSFLIGLGIPYASFVIMGFFTSPPKYHFRIAYIFVNISLIFIMMSLFKFTDPVRTSIMKRINAVVETVR
ncbi:unnamed protein product [Adineta steineri]|uniref:G-protein coupled receptors family 1 profile domain-containing protein n=1 Tax=Adineta steineri TaxID=433720 RepID=A0A815R8N9_9BILA|nr:unnamed protein product [Adineta steineri]CAF4002914.1 unnamed protein product [Adineta steineri]